MTKRTNPSNDPYVWDSLKTGKTIELYIQGSKEWATGIIVSRDKDTVKLKIGTRTIKYKQIVKLAHLTVGIMTCLTPCRLTYNEKGYATPLVFHAVL